MRVKDSCDESIDILYFVLILCATRLDSQELAEGITAQSKPFETKLALSTKITPHLWLARLFNLSSPHQNKPHG